MIGFGIKNKTDFEQVTEKSQGGIIGTAFVKILLEKTIGKKKQIPLFNLLSKRNEKISRVFILMRMIFWWFWIIGFIGFF
jgi:tryptophan synthase alpha subunit